MPMDSVTEAITRSMIRKGRNSTARSPAPLNASWSARDTASRMAPCHAVTTAIGRRIDIAATGMLQNAYHGKVKLETIA